MLTVLCITAKLAADGRCGSLAAAARSTWNVRFTPESCRRKTQQGWTKFDFSNEQNDWRGQEAGSLCDDQIEGHVPC